jgi:hypothetical protein
MQLVGTNRSTLIVSYILLFCCEQNFMNGPSVLSCCNIDCHSTLVAAYVFFMLSHTP